MKITFESHKLMSFFVENNCLEPIKQSKHTDNILEGIFNELLEVDKLPHKFIIFLTDKTKISRVESSISTCISIEII